MVNGAFAQVTEEARIWLPFPPSANNLFAHAPIKGKIRRFPTTSYKVWRKEAVIRIRSQRLPTFTAPVVIKLELTPRDMRRRDADNYVKPVLDALVEARLLADDSNRWVKAIMPYWENPDANAGVWVSIRPALQTRRPALSGEERKELQRLRARGGDRLVSPDYRPSAITIALVEKGYLEEAPGLIAECPQGYVVVE